MPDIWKSAVYATLYDIEIIKGKDNPEHKVRIKTEDEWEEFIFRSKMPGKAASAPFSIAKPGADNHVIKHPRGRATTDSDRQNKFEQIVRIMANKRKDNLAPATFRDLEGRYWKMDKDCAAWAATYGPFELVRDEHDRCYLKPESQK